MTTKTPSNRDPERRQHRSCPPRPGTARARGRDACTSPVRPSKTADIALAVWPCQQRTSQWQRYDRYLPASNRHPAKMLPELARRAIQAYSDPGDLVVDPMCGIGTTLVEAVHLDRLAIGIERESRWAALARANLAHARDQGAPGAAHVITGDARRLTAHLARSGVLRPPGARCCNVAVLPHGRVDLIVISPPYACHVANPTRHAWGRGQSLCDESTSNYSPDSRNLGHARGQAYLDAMNTIYRACATALKPGGYLVVVTKDMRTNGALRDLSGDTIRLCRQAGLLYWQHVIALLATIRDGQLVIRPSFWQLLQTRRQLANSQRVHLVCHEDVLVFRKPAKTTTRAQAVAVPSEPQAEAA